MDSLQVKQRNSAIDIFRLVCAIMVVAIHTHPFEELNEKLSFVATQIFPRIGVPFFFCIAGFYFTRKLLAGKPVKKQVFDLLSIYLFWSVDSIAIFGISSNPIFRIEKDIVFPPFGKRYFLNVTEFSGLGITG